MKAKLDFSQETSPNSPSRIFPQQFSKQPSSKNFLFNTSTFYSARMSETESEIYSHGLIREVMEASTSCINKAEPSRFGMTLAESIRILPSIPFPSSRNPTSIASIPFRPKTNYFYQHAQQPVTPTLFS